MKIPPFFIGAAVFFWGVQTGNPILGLLLFVILESVLVVKTRFALTDEDFIKIADLSSLLLIGSVALVLLNYEPRSFLRLTASWLPLTLAPLMLAQLYSEGDTLVIGTRFGRNTRRYAYKPLDFRIYYLVFCLFGAATANNRSIWFYLVLAFFLGILMFCNRGKATSPVKFASLFGCCCLIGYGGSLAIEAGHRYVLHSSFKMLSRYYQSQHLDPFISQVNFGDTGQLKFSGRIVMRVASESEPPELIRAAAYPTYHRGDWLGGQDGYSNLLPSAKQQWNLIEPPHLQGQRVTIEMALPQEKGILPLAYGAYRMASDEIFDVDQHRNGSIRVTDGATLVIYDLDYHRSMEKEVDLPREEHLFLPESERYVLEMVTASLEGLEGDEYSRVAALKNYFKQDFRYSLQRIGRGEYASPLGNFLLQEKTGFCEYYATATALLLRYLQIPSRYVIGYAVVERSALEEKYLVRDRHVHAWVEAYVDGRWLTIDTTPAAWEDYDAENASLLEPIWDLFNLLRHKYRIYQVGAGGDYTTLLTAIVVILVAFLSVRIYRRIRLERAEEEGAEVQRRFPRVITPLTPLLDLLSEVNPGKDDQGSAVQWAKTCVGWREFDDEEFEMLYLLHLQWRFDSGTMSERQRQKLITGAEKYSGNVVLREQE